MASSGHLLATALLATVLWPSAGFGQAPAGERPTCAIQYRNSAYASWICDQGGDALSDRATLFFLRDNRSGAKVVHRVWSGPTAQLAQTINSVVSEHQSQIRGCSTFFHVAGIAGEIQWNRVTPNMQKWWDKEGKKAFPGLCYSSDPGAADYLVVWNESASAIPYSFAVPIPQTSYFSGYATLYGSSGYASGVYSGSVTTNQMQTYSGIRNEWNVSVSVLPIEQRGNPPTLAVGTSLFWSDRTGRWRWSKPDKDALVEALQFLAGTRTGAGLK